MKSTATRRGSSRSFCAGSAKSFINEKAYFVQRGSFFLSKPGDWHYFRVTDKKNYEHRDLYLGDDEMKKVCRRALAPICTKD